MTQKRSLGAFFLAPTACWLRELQAAGAVRSHALRRVGPSNAGVGEKIDSPSTIFRSFHDHVALMARPALPIRAHPVVGDESCGFGLHLGVPVTSIRPITCDREADMSMLQRHDAVTLRC
jgi:hypothetical protein